MESTPLASRKIENVLDYMKTKHVSFKDILSYIVGDPSPRCVSYRRWLFDDLEPILDQMVRYDGGRVALRNWSLNFVCKSVAREMEKVKKAFTMKTSEITPEFVETWSFRGFQDVISRNAPTLSRILLAGVQTTRAKKERKKDPMIVCSFPGSYFSG